MALSKIDKREITKIVNHRLASDLKRTKIQHRQIIYQTEYVDLIRQLREYLKALDNGSNAQSKFRRLSLDAVDSSILPKHLTNQLSNILKDYTIDFTHGLIKSIHILKYQFTK